MDLVGFATVSKTPSTETQYYGGKLEDIAGRELPVIEKNWRGDCLCMVDGVGLVSVENVDVEKYREVKQDSVLDIAYRLMRR